MAADEAAYLARIAAAEGHVTGRFHGVCLSMLTETPFLALGSTTSKVQTLLADAGLGSGRLLSEAGLDALTAEAARRPFDAGEIAALRAFRAMAAREAARLFADIRGLAA
jgi:polysaccharide pyruvyl transferase WcaK-like protein